MARAALGLSQTSFADEHLGYLYGPSTPGYRWMVLYESESRGGASHSIES